MSTQGPERFPQIPGYRIQRMLGRGGMASVYLALQESVDREVALKVMAPQLSADPSFGDRFLREARIAAKLHHRSVVSIYDVAVHDGIHYCAMEFVSGGSIMRRGSPPLSLKAALRAVREIAGALNYAHEKGFIHRDVKPDNILLREDGSAVLSDFGIARAFDSATHMTKTGSVVGTPHYMSPEQLRGRAIDGRADLYSLGVVFYQLLTGNVPYNASDSLAIGIMHMTAPLPRLPAEYRVLQPILDRMMAKEPQDRYQTGAEIELALAAVEASLQSGALPAADRSSANTQPVAPMRAERKERVPSYESPTQVRTEPQLGRIDDMGDFIEIPARTGVRPAVAPRRQRTPGWIILVLLLVALGGLGYWQRERLQGLLDRSSPDYAAELQAADTAREEGRLIGEPGRDALSLYAAVLALDRDNQRAREGLDASLQSLEEEARLAAQVQPQRTRDIAERIGAVPGQGERARQLLALLEQRPPPVQPEPAPPVAPEPPPVNPPTPPPGLAEAEAAAAQGRWLGAGGALAAYARVLELAPDSADAIAGFERAVDAVLAEARAALKAGDSQAALPALDALRAQPRASAAAAALESEIAAAQSTERTQQQADKLVAEGQELLARAMYTEPKGTNAAERFQAALKLVPGHRGARQGLDRVAAALLVQARAALESNELERTRVLIRKAQGLAASGEQLAELKIRLEEAEEAERQPSAELLARYAQLIAEGQAAIERGELFEPPGDSAYDKFRAAMAIDPRNPQAREGMTALSQALKARAEEALANNRLERAHGAFEGIRSVARNDPSLPDLALRIANAYGARGLKAIAANRPDSAQEDLSAGESLAPDAPGLAELRAALGR